jgi:hypothetical protein
MDCLEAIRVERGSGQMFVGAVKHAESAAVLAASFGLNADAKTYREVDAELARAILVGILHRDLAYGTRLMSLSRAEELTSEFMQRFAQKGSRFFTNGEFKQDAGAGLVLSGWDPATSSTFDTGVLVLGSQESACVWVADED